MKTPWSEWIKYGVGTAAFLVIAAGGIILFAVVGVAILVAKISDFIK